jgi:hypothetical protein
MPNRRLNRGYSAVLPLLALLPSSCFHNVSATDCEPNPPHLLLLEMNDLRGEHGLKPLVANLQLIRAAQGHAMDLEAGEANAHIGRNGSRPIDRVRREEGSSTFTSTFVGVGENIAVNIPAPSEVVQAWLQSPSHRTVLLHPAYSQVGVGVVSTRRGMYWVADFGAVAEKTGSSPIRCHPWSPGDWNREARVPMELSDVRRGRSMARPWSARRGPSEIRIRGAVR